MPFVESSMAAQLTAACPIRREASVYTSGAGLPRGTSSDDTTTVKASLRPAVPSTASMTTRLADEASPRGQRWPRPAHRVDGAGQEGEPALVVREQALDHELRDLSRGELHGQGAVHIGGPLA